MTAAVDLDAVYVRLFPKLVGLLSLYCGDRWIAEEMAQESLSRLWERSRDTRIEDPDAWTYRVAMNLANSWFRRRAVERRLQRMEKPTAEVDPNERTDEAVVIRDALARLPRRQREAVLLRFFADLPIEDTARLMRCAPGTVKAHSHKALEALRRAGFEPEVDDG